MAKNARIHAEADRRLLTNRIALLKLEECNVSFIYLLNFISVKATKKIIKTENETEGLIYAYQRNNLRTQDRIQRT